MSPSLEKAFSLAQKTHTGQKKAGRPFIFHPMAVASLVLKYGGSDAQAIAGLLHDTLEKMTIADIKNEFGSEVADFVETFVDPPLPNGVNADWRNLKKAYVDKLGTVTEAHLMVVACEEFHDLSELLHDLRFFGKKAWERFPSEVDDHAVGWYYRALLKVFHQKITSEPLKPLVSDFARLIRDLTEIVFDRRSY